MSNKQSVYDYLATDADNDGGIIDFNEDNIKHIREQYASMTNEKKPTKDLLKQLAQILNINDDDKNLELLRLCIVEETIDDAKLEIFHRYYQDRTRGSSSKNPSLSSSSPPPSASTKDNPAPLPPPASTKDNPAPPPPASTKENPAPTPAKLVSIKEINCLIQMKIDHEELTNFLQDFLLRSLNQSISSEIRSTISLEKNVIHPLNDLCILDLFIRKQMAQRGVIDFGRERSKFRLVESISLNDEFDTWHFDHFHSLFDLFLTRPNNELFPVRWELINQSKITYQIISVYSTNDDDQKHIQRPSTKSLEKFIEDICQIEDNGMASNWIDSLRKEDITTYAHLTNLNQKEWDNIRKLSMNALKTIKTYVDREKQTAEDQTKTTSKRKSNLPSSIPQS
jgi:hypothetical protein